MENSRQNTRFHWRNAKRLERLSKIMDTTDDGNLQVNTGAIVNADNETISVTQEMKDAVSGNNEVIITITDDDWDESEECYSKRVELNNTYILFDFTGTHTFALRLYCPYFKGLAMGYSQVVIDGFDGYTENPGNGMIYLTAIKQLAVFNGIVTEIITSL